MTILLNLVNVASSLFFFPSKFLLNESKSFSKSKILSHLFMKQDSLFCFVMLRSPKPQCFMPHSLCIWKLSMSRGALSWLETVSCYGLEVIDY